MADASISTMWDIRKHSCELAMSFAQLELDFDTSVENWLAGTSYTTKEKEKFIETFNEKSIIEREDRKCKCFVKAESYPEFKYPRPIKSRTDRFKAVMGPIFQGINDCLFSKTEWFIKKIPVDERPQHIIENLTPYESILCTDFSSFEAHFIDAWIFCIEFPLYHWITMKLPNAIEWYNELNTLLEVNVCDFKDFTLHCMSRASGEMNTSSGNGYSNLTLYTYVARAKQATKMLGKFEGDDAITNTAPKSAEPTTQDFTDLGWSCKLERNQTISEASFCGIVSDENDLINICDVKNYILDFGWTRQQYLEASDNTIKALIRAKGFSAIYQYPNCPIIDSLGRYALRVTDSQAVINKMNSLIHKNKIYSDRYKNEQFKDLLEKYKNKIPPKKEIPISTRLLVEKLHGVSVSQQITTEDYLDSLEEVQPLTLQLQFNDVHYFTWDQYTTDQIDINMETKPQIEQFREFCRGWKEVEIRF